MGRLRKDRLASAPLRNRLSVVEIRKWNRCIAVTEHYGEQVAIPAYELRAHSTIFQYESLRITFPLRNV